jgi:hypothetical protein
MVLICALIIASPLSAQTMIKVPFPYSPINSSSLHWMVAKDARIFEKYGLDVNMVFMGASSLILQSMLSGAANFRRLCRSRDHFKRAAGRRRHLGVGNHAADHFTDDAAGNRSCRRLERKKNWHQPIGRGAALCHSAAT